MSEANNGSVIMVHTSDSADTIIANGQVGPLYVNTARADSCTYVVCTYNATNVDEPTAPHNAVFLIGKVAGVNADNEDGQSYIQISHYSVYNRRNVWIGNGRRSFVYHPNLASLHIRESTLKFTPVMEQEVPESDGPSEPAIDWGIEMAPETKVSNIVTARKPGARVERPIPIAHAMLIASCNLVIDMVKNDKVDQAKAIIEAMHTMIVEKIL